MDDQKYENFFKFLQSVLKLIGCNIFTGNLRLTGRLVFTFLSSSYVCIGALCMIKPKVQTISQIVDILSGFGLALQIIMKAVTMLYNQQKWRYLVKEIERQRKKQLIAPKYRQLLESYSEKYFRYARIFMWLYIITPGVVWTEPILSPDVYKLPVEMPTPKFTNPLLWSIVFMFDWFLTFMAGIYALSMECLFLLMLSHVLCNFEVISLAAKDLDELLDDHIAIDHEQYSEVVTKLKELHEHLVENNTFVELLNEIASPMYLIQLMTSSIMLCMTLYITMMTFFHGKLMYMFAIIFQCFVYCYGGELVRIKNNNAFIALTNIRWYNLPLSQQKAFKLIILHAQRIQTLSAIFAPLTLETFVQILKTAYSYCTVMQQMQ